MHPPVRTTRPSPRLLVPIFTVLAAMTTWLVGAPPAHALPPQEPGVTLRVFDVGIPLSQICTLKPAQTPNVDKLMPTINWTTTAQFGLAENFVTEVTANLAVTSAGSHTFRLTSDDGSRLWIDGNLVINHDGLHSPTAKDGSVNLSAGTHTLRIEHFERSYDQQITLEWKTPGSSAFTLVPNSALSTDADVVRVTAPGRKECESDGDSGGDGEPLTGVHPNYTLTNLRPTGFQPQVTGIDWLPDGRMVICTWGGSNNTNGEVYILTNTGGTTGPGSVTTRRIAQGLKEPMGIKVVEGKIYVSEKQRLTELVDTNADEVADQLRTVATWPFGGNFHEFAFGLIYENGFFYLNLSVSINYGGATTNPQPAANRGTTIKVNRATGAVEYVAGGLRTPHGIGWGPENGIFVPDNQGDWLPVSKLVHIKQGRFFNHNMTPDGPFDSAPVTPPVLWMPQNEIANSPSALVTLSSGPFAGQLLIGDVTYGGLQRAFLEKVGGEYQGALFRHTQGLEAGITEVHVGPDGAVYVGGLGAGGNWGQAGKLQYGLQKLTPNGTNAFDIKAMRAVADGFELEYTQPVSAATLATLASKYQVKQWRYQATAGYGGPKIGEETLTVASATASADSRKVTLRLNGLKEGHVVYVRSPRPFTSQTGASLWSTEAWYTLNTKIGSGGSTQQLQAEDAALSGGASRSSQHTGYTGTGFVQGYGTQGATTTFTLNAATAGAHNVNLRYANGPNPAAGTKSVSLYVNGTKVRQVRLASTGPWNNWADRVERVDLRQGSNTIAYKVDSGDVGHVNLDRITVAPVERVTLFDGTSVAAWQARNGGGAPTWPVADGAIESLGGDIKTRQKFGDAVVHVEWLEPQYAPDVTGQRRGNSGIFLQERYELQVLDSYGDTTLAADEAGAIYNKRAPSVNAARAPGVWQTYDITFRAARFDAAGNKVDNARMTVVWNGTVVHNDVEINGGTGDSLSETATREAIRLQDHGDPGPNPKFRNIWVEPLD